MPIHTVKIIQDTDAGNPRDADNLGVIVGPRSCGYQTEEQSHINQQLWWELDNLNPEDRERREARTLAIRELSDRIMGNAEDPQDSLGDWIYAARNGTDPEQIDLDICTDFFHRDEDSSPDDDLLEACESVGIYCIPLETDRRDSGRFMVSSEKNRITLGAPIDSVKVQLEAEAKEYTMWAQGDCWGFVIEDENGEHLDSCWGFIGDTDEVPECMSEHAGDEYKTALAEAWKTRFDNPKGHGGCESDTVEVTIMTIDENPAC
jgi:hypothetical protein